MEQIPIFYNYSDDVQSLTQDNSQLILIFNNFNKIYEINITNRYVIVEPGVKARLLNQKLEKDNFTFLPFFNNVSDMNIGQLIFNNVIGKNQTKTFDYILGLEVVLSNGELIQTGSKTLKSVSGYDVTSLFIGSQGIFGIVAKAILRIDPIIEQSDINSRVKTQIIQKKFNQEELKLLKKLKQALDPKNILNLNYLF